MSNVVPMLAYNDAPAAVAFLTSAFGFESQGVLMMPDGSVGHASLRHGDAEISLATTWRDGGMAPPSEMDAVHTQLQVLVQDVDAHYAAAKAAGATVMTEPEDQFYGHRMYRAIDPEGHRWVFSQVLREVSIEDMQKMME